MIKWLKKPTDNAFADANLAALQFSTDHHPVKLYCTDLTSVGPLSREQELWLSSKYYKKTFNVLKTDFFVAVVFSEEHFKAVVFNYQVPYAAPNHNEFVHFNYFTEQTEALHWLESIKKGQDTALHPLIS